MLSVSNRQNYRIKLETRIHPNPNLTVTLRSRIIPLSTTRTFDTWVPHHLVTVDTVESTYTAVVEGISAVFVPTVFRSTDGWACDSYIKKNFILSFVMSLKINKQHIWSYFIGTQLAPYIVNPQRTVKSGCVTGVKVHCNDFHPYSPLHVGIFGVHETGPPLHWIVLDEPDNV